MGIAIYTGGSYYGILQERVFYLLEIEKRNMCIYMHIYLLINYVVDSVACPFNYPMEP